MKEFGVQGNREIPFNLVPRQSFGAEIDRIDRSAEKDPLIGAKITDLMAGPDLNIGVDQALSNNARAIFTDLTYRGRLGGGTPQRALEVNTSAQPKHRPVT